MKNETEIEETENETETTETMTVKNIVLDDEFSIERDYASWNLKYAKAGEINPATGKPTIRRNTTYHVSLEHALETYMEQASKSCETIVDILLKLDEVKEVIKTALTEHAKVVQDSKVVRS